MVEEVASVVFLEDVISLSVGAEGDVSLSVKLHTAARPFLMFVLLFMCICHSSAAISFATVIALAYDSFFTSEQVTEVMT